MSSSLSFLYSAVSKDSVTKSAQRDQRSFLEFTKIFFDQAFCPYGTLHAIEPCRTKYASSSPIKLSIDGMSIDQVFEQLNQAFQTEFVCHPLPHNVVPNSCVSSSKLNSNLSTSTMDIINSQYFKRAPFVQLATKDIINLQSIESDMLLTATRKPWQLLGEAQIDERPENSLLDVGFNVDCDFKARAAPPITVEHTSRIEEIVKQRIKDHVFDDVERRHRPSDSDAVKRSNVLEDPSIFKKSELSLSETYAQKFENLLNSKDNVDSKLKIELIDTFKALKAKLDALSHNNFAPKLSELTEVTNKKFKSVQIENSNTSNECQEAAETLHVRKKLLKGEDELNSTDRKRMRKLKLKKRKLENIRMRRLEELKPKQTKKLKSLDEREAIKKVEKLISNSPHVRLAKKETKHGKKTNELH